VDAWVVPQVVAHIRLKPTKKWHPLRHSESSWSPVKKAISARGELR